MHVRIRFVRAVVEEVARLAGCENVRRCMASICCSSCDRSPANTRRTGLNSLVVRRELSAGRPTGRSGGGLGFAPLGLALGIYRGLGFRLQGLRGSGRREGSLQGLLELLDWKGCDNGFGLFQGF